MLNGKDEGGVGALEGVEDMVFSEGAKGFLGDVGVAGFESCRGVGVIEESWKTEKNYSKS